MKHFSRRTALKGAVASTTATLFGCGGGDPEAAPVALDAAPDQQALRAIIPPPPPPEVVRSEATTAGAVPRLTSKYRSEQPYLFQGIRQRYLASRLANGQPLDQELYGPTHAYVDFNCGWTWNNPGGDWIDANGVRQGSAPWFSLVASAAKGSTSAAAYKVDVTSMLKYVQSHARWCAMLITSPNVPRVLACLTNTTHAVPFIDVVYTTGARARLACRVTAVVTKSSEQPVTTKPEGTLPVFLEFDRPTAQVQAATLNFVITQHWSGSNPVLRGFLLDPPPNSDVVRNGVAAHAGRLDQDLHLEPSIIGVHRYIDGAQDSDYVLREHINKGSEREFDPAIWGTGPSNTTKLPHRGLGKWIGARDNWSLVNSTFTEDGFAPLTAGLGAMRITMAGNPGLHDGSVVGYGGTLAGNGQIFLPEALFGRLGRIFVRHYFRLGTPGGLPYAPNAADRLHVYATNSLLDSAWTDSAGKFGIMPEHTTSIGGVSGSSGGGAGWQMRMSWADCDAGTGGPDEAGWTPGYHFYDFYWRNPPGHNYTTDKRRQTRLGQRGGLGGILYANQWYCIESELKLNTVMAASPGYLADGEVRTWIDGRLAFERTGMVFRTLPVISQPYDADRLRPCRELGVKGLWLNWFHGGKTLNVKDRAIFVTGLAWGKEYIGPMTL